MSKEPAHQKVLSETEVLFFAYFDEKFKALEVAITGEPFALGAEECCYD